MKTKLNHYKHKKNPWISKGIINSIEFGDKMYGHLRLTNCDSPMYETLEKNKHYNCILQRKINAAKSLCYESKFNKYVSNIKQTWITINELLNKCNNKNEFPSYFMINGDKIDNKQDIAKTSTFSFKILVQLSLQTFLNTKT